MEINQSAVLAVNDPGWSADEAAFLVPVSMFGFIAGLLFTAATLNLAADVILDHFSPYKINFYSDIIVIFAAECIGVGLMYNSYALASLVLYP